MSYLFLLFSYVLHVRPVIEMYIPSEREKPRRLLLK